MNEWLITYPDILREYMCVCMVKRGFTVYICLYICFFLSGFLENAWCIFCSFVLCLLCCVGGEDDDDDYVAPRAAVAVAEDMPDVSLIINILLSMQLDTVVICFGCVGQSWPCLAVILLMAFCQCWLLLTESPVFTSTQSAAPCNLSGEGCHTHFDIAFEFWCWSCLLWHSSSSCVCLGVFLQHGLHVYLDVQYMLLVLWEFSGFEY